MGNLAAGDIRNMDERLTTERVFRTDTPEIRSLLHLSARIGRDRLLVQASSGNTSFKLNGTLWIKASGKWLANADKQEILVPIGLSECLECLKDGKPLPAWDGDSCASCLLPSIETFMHAVLPQRFVIHVHSVNTLAWAVRSDATAQLAERLSGLPWTWIPYVPSGLALAREVEIASSIRPHTDIFILGNHGLVVCGESCDAAESVLSEVERRLAAPPRPATKPRFSLLERIQRFSCWRLPDFEALHTLGTNVISRRIVQGGVLYPCQAIFLGSTLRLLPAPKDLSDLTRRIDQLDTSCPFLLVEGSGVLINSKITAAENAVLNGFAEVVRRIETSAPIRYLTDYELKHVLSADGHRYRMSAENSAVSF